jgi:hypothetical protein
VATGELATGDLREDAAANDLVIVSADTDFGEMLGFTDTIFGQTPGS